MKRKISIFLNSICLCLGLCLQACNYPEQIEKVAPTNAQTSSIPLEITSTPTQLSIPKITLVTTGATEVVFDWSNDRCADFHILDLPARAFRDVDGNVQLLSTHLDNRRMIGPNLNELTRDCQIVMKATHNADPSRFQDNQWIASTYTEDGVTIYAIVHNEFHGWEHGERCPGENFTCWYNAITMSVSNDAGLSYHEIEEPPAHFVAGLSIPYEAGAGPYGVFEPSNIIKKDGYFYLFVRIDRYQSDEQRICLLRTDDLSKPSSWRAWDGAEFSLEMIDPYARPEEAKSARGCYGLDGDLGLMDSSITYNTAYDLFVMVGVSAIHLDGREVWGVMYSFSRDLINWEPRQLLMEVELMWTYQFGDGSIYHYPSILDADSISRNFETTDDTAYLYLTRFNENYHLDRDMIRIPIQFFLSEEEAKLNEVPFVP